MQQIATVSANTIPASAATGYVSDLDTPLLMFSERDIWTLRDAAEGVLITGGIGSGKSSGSGATLFKSYLRAGFGGIVCCANIDEVERWRGYCEETGRLQSLIVIDKSLTERFNFLEYQMTVGRGSVFEAVRVLLDILNAAEGRIEEGGDGKDQFWQQTLKEILGKTLAPLWAAYGRITLPEIMRFILDRPKSEKDLGDDAWQETSFWAQTIARVADNPTHEPYRDDIKPVVDYWTNTLMTGDARTTGNIIQTLTARLDPFTSGDLRRLFTTTTTVVPEMTFEGAVIVLDLSAHEWGEEGILAQHIFKTMWQRAIQRRPKTATARPCFLAADECQYFLAAADQQFQSTSRACRALTVYLTQNLPGVYAKIGGNRAQDVADALLGNLATKFFHAQPDPRTAEWAANMIGKAVVWRENVGENESINSGKGGNSSSSGGGMGQKGQVSSGSSWQIGRGQGTSRGASQTVDYRLQPSHFSTLLKGGGPERMSEAVIFQAGRVFAYTGSTWTPALFRQG